MNRSVVHAAVLTVLLAASACGGSADAVITGTVAAGPVCPVEREGEPCPDKKVANAEVFLTDEDGETVAETRTNQAGSFTLQVRAGHYNITASTDEAMSCDGEEVTVAARRRETVNISCDTGIR